MMQLRPILDSDRTVGARRLLIGAGGIGIVATWTGCSWVLADDPVCEIHDAEVIGEIDLDD